jgi:hypothetical protein
VISILSPEAVAAINRLVIPRLKRYLAGLPAFGTDSVEHLTVTAPLRVAFPCIAAWFAALGLVCKAFFCMKFLIPGGKSEVLSAILADEDLVVVH